MEDGGALAAVQAMKTHPDAVNVQVTLTFLSASLFTSNNF